MAAHLACYTKDEAGQTAKHQAMKNLTLASFYVQSLSKFTETYQFPDLSYLENRNKEFIIEKTKKYIASSLFEKDKTQLNEGVNPALYSMEWGQNLINIYQIREKKFETRGVDFSPCLPTFSRWCITQDGEVYLTGGVQKQKDSDEQKILRTCYMYSDKGKDLIKKKSMFHRRADHSTLYHSGFIYAVGSFSNINQEIVFSRKCEKYDVAADEWVKIAPMSKPRSGVGLCSFNENFIFAFGGRDSFNNRLDIIEVYDIKNDFWRNLDFVDRSPWNHGAYLCMAIQINKNDILIFGKS